MKDQQIARPRKAVCEMHLAHMDATVTGINLSLVALTHSEMLTELQALRAEVSKFPDSMAGRMLLEMYEWQERMKRPRGSNDDKPVEWL